MRLQEADSRKACRPLAQTARSTFASMSSHGARRLDYGLVLNGGSLARPQVGPQTMPDAGAVPACYRPPGAGTHVRDLANGGLLPTFALQICCQCPPAGSTSLRAGLLLLAWLRRWTRWRLNGEAQIDRAVMCGINRHRRAAANSMMSCTNPVFSRPSKSPSPRKAGEDGQMSGIEVGRE